MNTSNSKKSLSEVHGSVNTSIKNTGFKKLLAFFGPAYMVSVGYMDPGNWATDIAAGSKFGYNLLWVLLMSNLIALLLQSLSARLGIVTGRDLAQASRENYPKYINVFLYFFAEIAIAACDLAEVLGMAIGLQLLFNLPILYGVVITVLDSFLLVYLINFGIKKMEAFIISLVAIIGLSFLAEMMFAKPDMALLIRGFKPGLLSEEGLYLAIGIIGATVMPHNLYLHSSLVQTRKFERNDVEIKRAIKFNIIDSAIALNLAFFVNASILILAAATFFKNNMFDVAEIQDAYKFLAPIIGNNYAPTIFAIALIAAGQSSTITGTLAGQIVMEGYLNLRIAPWMRRLLTRMLAIIPAFIVIYSFGESATGRLLIMSQVILSMQLGFAVIPLIHFVSDKTAMGRYAISTKTKIAAWLSALVIVSLNIKLVTNFLIEYLNNNEGLNILKLFLILFMIVTATILLFTIFYPFAKQLVRVKPITPHGTISELVKFKSTAFNKIAITVDFGNMDSKAIGAAIAQGGKKSVYYIIHISESAGALVLGNETDDLESNEDLKHLKQYEETLIGDGYNVNIKLGFGNPKKSIPEIVNQINPDLLVMGAHGHNAFKDLLFGTTLEKVRHKVNAAILIVRE
jgi:manganese transport protein